MRRELQEGYRSAREWSNAIIQGRFRMMIQDVYDYETKTRDRKFFRIFSVYEVQLLDRWRFECNARSRIVRRGDRSLEVFANQMSKSRYVTKQCPDMMTLCWTHKWLVDW